MSDVLDWSDIVMARVVRLERTCAKCSEPATAIVAMHTIKGDHFIACACDVHAEETIGVLRETPGMRELDGTFANETVIRAMMRSMPDMAEALGETLVTAEVEH